MHACTLYPAVDVGIVLFCAECVGVIPPWSKFLVFYSHARSISDEVRIRELELEKTEVELE